MDVPRETRPLALGLWLYLALLLAALRAGHFELGTDLAAYWSAWAGSLYEPGARLGQLTYLYSPVFAQGLFPFTLLPWVVFRLAWTLAAIGAYWWLVRPLRWTARLPALGIALISALVGNVDWLIALAIAVAARYPAVWAVVLLSRISPAVAMLWYLVRREWRPLALAIGATGALAAPSVLATPTLWMDWLGVLTRSGGGDAGSWVVIGMPPLPARVALAAVIVALGARHDWRPAIAVAAVLGSPDLWPWTPAIMLSIPRLDTHAVATATAITRPPEPTAV